ncbi:MAG: DUF3410 domain-containing protein, partial [Ignavibacteria bacterium]|nr:DUF3410 domain-containing protein [Ignavibacteria bacterium]
LLSRSEIGIEVTNTIITKPLQRSGDLRNFVVLDDIYKCDIITLHTPLNLYGRDKTYHLFNNHNLSKLKDGAVLINTSRGAVINNLDLLNSIEKKKLKVVLDVWENEPDINVDLLKAVLIATPHIAGYSYEGKVNGTKMIYDSLCKFLDEEKVFSFNMPYEGELKVILKNTEYFMDEKFVKDIRLPPLIEVTDKIENGLEKLISNIYSINDDDERMRKMLAMNKREKIKYFDSQRKNYPMRREFNNYSVKSDNLSEDVKNILERLRFNLA